MITSLISQLHRTRDLLLQLNFQNKTHKDHVKHKNKSNQIWVCNKNERKFTLELKLLWVHAKKLSSGRHFCRGHEFRGCMKMEEED